MGTLALPGIEIQRAEDRFVTKTSWLQGRHSFSFGWHYDPENTNHGLLLVNNDDVVQPRTGFDTHPHRDMEIVTWVLEGELEHKDTLGNSDVIYPGLAQRMSAGRGIWHSEKNPSQDKVVRLVQMWVLPDTESIDPSYQQMDINPQLAAGGLVPLASGRDHHAAIRIRQQGAVLWVGRLAPGGAVTIPDSQFAHVYIAQGAAVLEGGGDLREGDSARLTLAGAPELIAGRTGAEVLVWDINVGVGEG
ncbi:MAG: pirin family protein [SAR202 cluster bacterium]|nr:pirin family protein [SAR202 cluster bacterium]